MKSIIKLAFAASIAASGAMAQPRQHQHAHLHKKNVASPVERRDAADVVVEYEVGPTVTTFELSGETIDNKEAQQGIEDGVYVVVGETHPSYVPPPPPAPEPTTSEAPAVQAQFFEEKETSSSSEPTPEPSPEPKPSPKPAPKKVQEPKPEKQTEESGDSNSSSGGGSSAGKGVEKSFPSGKVKCTEFPSDYGAIAVDWLDMNGWVGIQKTPDFNFLADKAISYIKDGISGENCSPNSFCSYACPIGYQKTQWPTAQGADRESIGGLWCNADGYLELSRKEHDTLCEEGAGGVWIQNDLDDVAAVCRTDYPGNEAMVIPSIPQPGEKIALCNPDSDKYYEWDGMPTTAQYYVNNKGLSAEDACVWNSKKSPKSAGNWSPMNIGTGKASDGNTYISIFPNWPTSDAVLDFNVEVKGDVNGKCAFVNGKFVGDGATETGCTTTLTKTKGDAIIRFYSGSS